MGFKYIKQTNFYLISHEDYFAADILGALLEHAVIIRSASAVGERFLRITIGSSVERMSV